MQILYVGLIFRIALVFSFILFPSVQEIVGSGDSYYFYFKASELSLDSLLYQNPSFGSGEIYISFLSVIFKIFGSYYVIGNLSSVMFWFFSALFLKKILNLFLIKEFNKNLILFLYCFLPSSILFTTTILREPMQIFLINAALYFLLKNYIKFNFLYLFYVVFFSIILASLHWVYLFVIFCTFLCILFLYFVKKYINNSSATIVLVFSLVTSAMFLMFPIYLYKILSIFFSLGTNSIISSIELYLNSNFITEATYFINFEISNFFNFFQIFLYYMLKPFPSDFRNFFDLVLFFENLFRVFLIFIFIKRMHVIKNTNVLYTFLVIFIFLIEIFWSLGTSNWGTAVRHHQIVYGIMLILAFGESENAKAKSTRLSL